jgi:sarcosine/dimethylglycine N-methyltransferase
MMCPEARLTGLHGQGHTRPPHRWQIIQRIVRFGAGTVPPMSERKWTQPVTVEQMYGDWDWEAAVEAVGRSLDPRPSSSIFDTLETLGLGPDDRLLDIGGRDARHGLEMAERFGCTVVSVDPSAANIADGEAAVAGHDHGHLVSLALGTIEHIPADDAVFTFVFSRDMFAHVEDADQALAECARVLVANGVMVLHQVFATELLEPIEAEQVFGHTAGVPARFSVDGFEESAISAGFAIEDVEVLGGEWYEASQEAGTAPNYLLQVSRLRRAQDALIAEIGEVPYRVVYGNALWSINQMLGKLESRVYVLRRSQT